MSAKSKHRLVALDGGRAMGGGRPKRQFVEGGTRPAVIDIGSNSVRLVVYDSLRRSAIPILNEKVLCGLGRGLRDKGLLQKDSMRLAVGSLVRFMHLAEVMRVGRLDLIATAAVRDANNGAEFVSKIGERCGLPVTVLSGKDEARLSALGVLAGLPDANGLVADLGGGSLELSLLSKGETDPLATLPLGPLRLMGDGNPGGGRVCKTVAKALAKCKAIDGTPHGAIYCVGGAWRALAKLHMLRTRYPLRIVQGYESDARDVAKFADSVSAMDSNELAKLPGLPRGRRAGFPYAARVLHQLIQAARPERVIFSAFGLREGWLHDMLPDAERSRDPLLDVAADWETRDGRVAGAGDALHDWTTALFPSEKPGHARLRRVACRLSDIGWREHPDYRGQETLNRILRAGFPGANHRDLAYLGFAVFNRYGGLSHDSGWSVASRLLGRGGEIRAVVLGRALRLGYTISGGMPEILNRTKLSVSDGKVDLVLPDDGSAPTNDRWRRDLASLRKALKAC